MCCVGVGAHACMCDVVGFSEVESSLANGHSLFLSSLSLISSLSLVSLTHTSIIVYINIYIYIYMLHSN